jgi:hypothetical protein
MVVMVAESYAIRSGKSTFTPEPSETNADVGTPESIPAKGSS